MEDAPEASNYLKDIERNLKKHHKAANGVHGRRPATANRCGCRVECGPSKPMHSNQLRAPR